MTRYQFEGITFRRERSGKCAGCGNRTRRTVAVTHTVNPFNRTEQPEGIVRAAQVDMERGRPKTREEVTEDVRRELAAKCEKPLLCSKCEASS